MNVDGRRRRPWALDSKERILSAAIEEIASVGFERARLSEIAQRAGMTPGSVYTWFENKEVLFREALESALTNQVSSNTSAIASLIGESDNWLVKVATLVPRNHVDTGPTEAQVLLIEAYYAAWRDPDAREALRGGLAAQLDMYRNIVRDSQRRGDIASDLDVDALATLLLAIPTGLSLINLAGLPRVADESWHTIYSRLGHGFRN